VFQPLEETLRTVLSPLLSSPSPSSLHQSSTLLTTVLKLYTLLALIIGTLVPPLLPTFILPFLTLLLGPRFSPYALSPILSAYLYYIPIMAVNGITEAFIASVASPGDLARQSRAMVLFSVVFMAASWGLLRGVGMGGEGLVWANCANMLVRIVWSWAFISRWYGERKGSLELTSVLPSWRSGIAATVVGLLFRVLVERLTLGMVGSLAQAAVGGIVLLVCMYPPCRVT
jgi:Rft protein